jgi:hypothetical protein
MSRNIATAVIVGLIAASFIGIWFSFVHVKPDATVTTAQAAAAPMPSPFDIMVRHGKTLPVEHWRDAF